MDVTLDDVLTGVKVTPGWWVDAVRVARWFVLGCLAIASLTVLDQGPTSNKCGGGQGWMLLWAITSTAALIAAIRPHIAPISLSLIALLAGGAATSPWQQQRGCGSAEPPYCGP